MSALLPWQTALWRRQMQSRAGGRVPHALLLLGRPHSGKSAFARALGHAALCEQPQPEGLACGRCRACQQIAAGSHPDLHTLELLEDKKEILIDQVRAFCAKLQLTSTRGGARVGLLYGADLLGMHAANSLLKTLEEPAAGIQLILTASNPSRVQATIRSRCQMLAMPMPDLEQATAWLRSEAPDAVPLLGAAGGNPLHARQLLDGAGAKRLGEWEQGVAALASGRGNPLSLAAALDSEDWQEFLRWWQGWLLQRCREAGREAEALFEVWDELLAIRRRAHTPIKRLLALEGLFILFARACYRVRTGETTP